MCRWCEQHGPDELHDKAADRVGEGVPLQQVPDPGSTNRDRGCAATQRDAGQDLVPEPTDEAEETNEGRPDPAGSLHDRRDTPAHGRRSFPPLSLSPQHGQ